MSKIKRSEIVLGQPLGFNCYDSQGRLLLQRGLLITSSKQVDALLERGLFSTPGAQNEKQELAAPKEKKKLPFEMFDSCKNRVRTLFSRIKIDSNIEMAERLGMDEIKQAYRDILNTLESGKQDSFQEKILLVCKELQELCACDTDAALGAIHLDKICRYTTIHPLHTAILSELLARSMNISAQERLSIMAAALTSNISILDFQEALHAEKSLLSESQQRAMRLHPVLSAEMLYELGVKDELWTQTVLHHHEKFNGSGYPGGKLQGEIPRSARIVALADTYSAMIKPRAYREALHAKDALKEIFVTHAEKEERELAHCFIKEVGIFPPGCFVKLQNGETAIVTRRGESPSTPKVKSVVNSVGMPLLHSVDRDTSLKPHSVSGIEQRNKLIQINLQTLWGYKLAA